jgi:phage-related protein
MLLRLTLVLVVLSTAVAAAGCGGSSSSASSADDWANGLCSALVTWTNSVKSAAGSLKGDMTKDGLESATGDITSASDTLVSDLKDLGKPDTEGGQQAKDAVDQLSGEIEQDVENMQSTVDKASETGALAAASSVAATLTTMGTQIGSAAAKLGDADPGGELKQAFQSSSACKTLSNA